MDINTDFMLSIKRTDSRNQDFIVLVKSLDTDLAKRDGEDHAYSEQFNKIDLLKHVIVGYIGSVPVACGAIKEFDEDSTEVKRMYVIPKYRGRCYASIVLKELEKWASDLGYQKCVLETGLRQPEAIGLYTKNGYESISNYGQYKGIDNSCCFEKRLM